MKTICITTEHMSHLIDNHLNIQNYINRSRLGNLCFFLFFFFSKSHNRNEEFGFFFVKTHLESICFILIDRKSARENDINNATYAFQINFQRENSKQNK